MTVDCTTGCSLLLNNRNQSPEDGNHGKPKTEWTIGTRRKHMVVWNAITRHCVGAVPVLELVVVAVGEGARRKPLSGEANMISSCARCRYCRPITGWSKVIARCSPLLLVSFPYISLTFLKRHSWFSIASSSSSVHIVCKYLKKVLNFSSFVIRIASHSVMFSFKRSNALLLALKVSGDVSACYQQMDVHLVVRLSSLQNCC